MEMWYAREFGRDTGIEPASYGTVFAICSTTELTPVNSRLRLYTELSRPSPCVVAPALSRISTVRPGVEPCTTQRHPPVTSRTSRTLFADVCLRVPPLAKRETGAD